MNKSVWFNCLMAIAIILAMVSVGCGDSASSFSILPTGQGFQQNGTAQNSKIDILWVIDNSGSMDTSQQNLSQNFPSFISGFSSRGLDFHMGVVATDTFIALPSMTSIYNGLPSNNYLKSQPQANWAGLRDGGYISGSLTHSGFFILDSLTPNINSVFVTNAMQGISGLGDERPLQSMRVALESPLNAGLVRPNSYLAVISLTDEDDFSHDGTAYLENQYSNPALHTIDSYVATLESVTQTTLSQHRFAFHSIAIQDTTCRNQLGSGRKIGVRVNAMADATAGTKLSLCGDFATQLSLLANNIIELAHQFYLSTVPIESTISVSVNGVAVPNALTNPGPTTGGWIYNSSANSIIFQGDHIPPAGASIFVAFDPASLGG